MPTATCSVRYSPAMANHDALTSAPWFAPIVAVVSATLGAFGLWLANRMLGKAAFQTAINSGFDKLTDQLQEERAALLKERNEERVAWAAERAQLRGEIINLTQAVESLKAYLRRNGLDIPDVYHAPTEMIVVEKK